MLLFAFCAGHQKADGEDENEPPSSWESGVELPSLADSFACQSPDIQRWNLDELPE